jgi:uncharacterized membrane protein
MSGSNVSLAIFYWLHLAATVFWLGGMAAVVWVILPALSRPAFKIPVETQLNILQQTLRRVQAVGWFCLLVLSGTGMFQMSSNVNYKGFLEINGSWAWAILLKHIWIGGLILVQLYQSLGLEPELNRLILLTAKNGAVPKEKIQAFYHKQRLAWIISLVFMVIILGLTALARVS